MGILLLLILCSLVVAILGLIRPDFIIRWGAPEKRTRLKAFSIGFAAALVFAATFAIMAVVLDIKAEMAAEENAEIPTTQTQLVSTIDHYANLYENAKDPAQKAKAKKERATALLKIFGPDLAVSNWVGTLYYRNKLSNGDAYIEVRLRGANGWELLTTNNEDSNEVFDCLIKVGSKVHTALSDLRQGDSIQFNGHFFPESVNGLAIFALTESGLMANPQILFKFTSIKKL